METREVAVPTRVPPSSSGMFLALLSLVSQGSAGGHCYTWVRIPCDSSTSLQWELLSGRSLFPALQSCSCTRSAPAFLLHGNANVFQGVGRSWDLLRHLELEFSPAAQTFAVHNHNYFWESLSSFSGATTQMCHPQGSVPIQSLWCSSPDPKD